MGIKKIARPMNKAKNEFLKWLKKNNADNIDIYAPEDSEWNYYVMVSGFISSHLYTSTFMVLKEKQSVDSDMREAYIEIYLLMSFWN